ncbi:MAG TPA: alcohol dehydrogenase catalytic domain-containing protein [Pyrinomonadaceae bacterium]|nr:alcohol dehydrogenase catalytic domain-containing protein [Pyrinomonadaceae bacterium]
MQALRLTGRDLKIEDVPLPGAAHEALVRVRMSGICNTDLEIVRGYAGFRGTLGHEFVGTVEKADDRPEIVGKRVVGEINAGCGECSLCVIGDSRHCPERTVLGIVGRDGAHAEFLALPSRNLYEVPESVNDDAAVFTEPLAAAYGITERVDISPETLVVVIGDGKLGLLCAMALKLKTEDVSIIGRHRSKLSIAENVGIKAFLADEGFKVGRRFDVVVDATGSESGMLLAVDLVRPLGSIVLKSTFHGAPAWPASRIVIDEISVVGSRCGRFEPALRLLEDKKIDPTPLISDECALEDGVEAFDRAKEKGVLKVLLRMDQ